jgi:chromate transport protein ChrA
MQYVGFALYVVFRGFPSPIALALGIAPTPSLINLFLLGLVAGSLSFGGAYTAIPFIQVEAVLRGGWLPQSVFIDCIAIGNVLPAPLVIFATFVGFQGGLKDGGLGAGFAGAVVITLGMFFPCFLFTIAGHSLLEKLVRNKVILPPPLTFKIFATAAEPSSFFQVSSMAYVVLWLVLLALSQPRFLSLAFTDLPNLMIRPHRPDQQLSFMCLHWLCYINSPTSMHHCCYWHVQQ